MIGDEIPHLAWPFRNVGGRFATVDQDTIEDVRQNVHAYLNTGRGERSLSPDFGVEDLTFSSAVNTALLAAEIEEAEAGRAAVEVVAEPVTGTGRMAVEVHVELAE